MEVQKENTQYGLISKGNETESAWNEETQFLVALGLLNRSHYSEEPRDQEPTLPL